MSPTLRELIVVLEAEITVVSELLEILQKDQQRIVQHDIPGLEASNLRKEERVLRFQSLEQSRMGLTATLGKELGLPADQVRVSTLCPLLGPDADALESTAGRLRALVASVGELVAVSRGFLEQSILGFRGLLALIQTLRSPEPGTYDASGRHALGEQPALTLRREA